MLLELLEKFEDIFQPASRKEIKRRNAEELEQKWNRHLELLKKLPDAFTKFFTEANAVYNDLKLLISYAELEIDNEWTGQNIHYFTDYITVEFSVIPVEGVCSSDRRMDLADYHRGMFNKLAKVYLDVDITWAGRTLKAYNKCKPLNGIIRISSRKDK